MKSFSWRNLTSPPSSGRVFFSPFLLKSPSHLTRRFFWWSYTFFWRIFLCLPIALSYLVQEPFHQAAGHFLAALSPLYCAAFCALMLFFSWLDRFSPFNLSLSSVFADPPYTHSDCRRCNAKESEIHPSSFRACFGTHSPVCFPLSLPRLTILFLLTLTDSFFGLISVPPSVRILTLQPSFFLFCLRLLPGLIKPFVEPVTVG